VLADFAVKWESYWRRVGGSIQLSVHAMSSEVTSSSRVSRALLRRCLPNGVAEIASPTRVIVSAMSANFTSFLASKWQPRR
jgi:hypothetical protein